MSVQPQRKGGDKLDLYERQIKMLDTLFEHGRYPRLSAIRARAI